MKKFGILILVGFFLFPSCEPKEKEGGESVRDVMDNVVTRLYSSLTSDQLDTIGNGFIMNFLTEKEKHVLATKYWYFTVNVPVRVSLMHDKSQKTLPFWLGNNGFKKTKLKVKKEHSVYEVWQKDFPAGKVQLGVNGFDQHRPVYFICVGPENPRDSLIISNVYPENQDYEKMQVGAFTYHDWDELTLDEVPEELTGQILFHTIRGRAREAHLIGAFRRTPYPSGEKPDQVLLTWSDDAERSVDIQWRTNTTVPGGSVKYWIKGTKDTLTTQAEKYLMEDRLLQNDRYIHRFTAKLKGLTPGSLYQYKVGSPNGYWSDDASFRTEVKNTDKFSFIWFGDTHKSPKWGDLLQKSFQKYPETAFYSIAGDLVSTGLHRDHWDELFHYAGKVFAYKPLMPVPGNHDNQDGLGAWMYQEMFSLPKNGPAGISPELTYAFKYGNALFLMIDATQPNDLQTGWIEEQLKNADAVWKFAMFHFPPYTYEEDYSDIRQKWCTLFDKYHVDMVMSGHTHYYMRSKPIFNEKVVDKYSKGTVYVISVGIPGNHEKLPPENYVVVQDEKGWLYQHMEIDDHRLIYKSLDIDGNVKDEFVITK